MLTLGMSIKVYGYTVTDPAVLDRLVFMWVEENTEVYAGESEEEIKRFFESLNAGVWDETDKGTVDGDAKRNVYNPITQESDSLTLREMLKQDLAETGRISIPNIVWTTYN